MEAGYAAKGGVAAPKTLCMTILRITESAATVNGHGCVATPKLDGSVAVIFLAKIQV